MTEEQMEKAAWLNRAYHAKNALKSLERIKAEKQSIAALCGISYESDGSTSSGGSNSQERKLLNMIEIDEKINRSRQELMLTYAEVEQAINNVEDIELRNVLAYHYLSFMSWEAVAEQFPCAVRTVKYKHKKALDKVCIVLHP